MDINKKIFLDRLRAKQLVTDLDVKDISQLKALVKEERTASSKARDARAKNRERMASEPLTTDKTLPASADAEVNVVSEPTGSGTETSLTSGNVDSSQEAPFTDSAILALGIHSRGVSSMLTI